MNQPQPRSVTDILNSPAMVNKITAKVHEFEAAQDAEIAHLVDEIRQLSDEAVAIEDKVHAAKAQLRTRLEARGGNWQDENGHARIVSGFTRSHYDSKALDDLRLKSAWWDKRLRSFYKPSEVKSYLSVK